ncbi:hypothetical protein BLNAU_15299 [Blattamonas nauphoetae]|uniref:Uncharacterized protein n=1 Tax=Blattamonas nauphoetae TaxID=2049346 RepID=A0ABQ9XET3_9EUKA|nr:hypothetical protein BLNAU_15299 [Blattamonas nauphoetae]
MNTSRLSNNFSLISNALTILDELFNLVQAAASPPQNGNVSLSNQTIPEESSMFMKAWAALDSFFRRVQNFRIEQSLQNHYNKFKSAYQLIPYQAQSDTETVYDSFDRLWSTYPHNFYYEQYLQLHFDLRGTLEKWEKDSRMIFRNLQISIDSSINPLRQTEIPDYEAETEYAKPFNKAKYMYKSINTLKNENNFLKLPIDLLFRPSTYSLFSHILFNSNGYVRTYFHMDEINGSKPRWTKITTPSIYHVVTGTPGIGKSAIRIPLITLAMSLGANEVKTARHGEPAFIFTNRNLITSGTDPIPCDYDERSFQAMPLPPIGKATIEINRKDRQTVRIHKDTFCYTYHVMMCKPISENKVYDPKQLYSSPEFIGQVTVPSIHHFPHFFKLFVNQDNQVENRLRGATWHIVDDFVLRSAHIPQYEHVVLLASAKERWEKITTYKQLIAPIMIYNMPTLLYPEMIHLFNAIPCPYHFYTDQDSMMMTSRKSILKQGMIPRDVFTPHILNNQYRSIHSSSPQFDPMNWFAQPATQIASIAQFEPQGSVSVGDNRIPAMTATTTPILARALEEEVNKNPHAVRCAYCGSLVTEDFPNHYCVIDLVYSNKPDIQSSEEHIHLTIHIPPSDKNDKKKEEERNVDFVAETSGIPHKKVSSGLWPTMQSHSHHKQYVEVTCTSVIPDPPDVYRLPFPPPPSAMRRTQSTPNDVTPHFASAQQVSGSPNALSSIIDAHCLWSGRFRMSCEQVGKCQYKPIKLNEQPYQSLMFDLPSVDITKPMHNMQYMLPAVPNASVDPLVVYPKQVANPLRSKRVAEDSLWQMLNCLNLHAGMGDAVQTDEMELTERPANVTKPTHHTQSMLPAVPCARIGALDVSSETVTDYLRSKRVEYEYFWQWLNRKNAPAGMGDALEADEAELSERIRNSGNENEKSRVTCLLARELLLRSRLSLHKREVDAAWFFFRQSKQRMVLNDTAEVEYELMLASDSNPDTSSCGSDELERVLINARDCFGMNWEQWIQEGQDLPILLNPCFHILQFHLKQVQDHVNTLRSHLKSIGVTVHMMDESQRTMMENALLQTLKEGLTLQLLIAWKTGYRDQLAFFRNELNSTFQNEGDMMIRAMTTPFRSQENQIGDLDIDNMINAIGNILNTARSHCDTWSALVREHQQNLGSEPHHSGNLEGNGSTHKVRMMIGDNSSVSGTPPTDTSAQRDIRTNSRLLIDRLNAIIAVCHQTLDETNKNEVVNALSDMIAELIPFLTTTSNLDADVGIIEGTSSRVMVIIELKGETGLPADTSTKFDAKDFGKQKRTDKTDSGPFDPPSKAEKRLQISRSSSAFPSSHVDLPNREAEAERTGIGLADVADKRESVECS